MINHHRPLAGNKKAINQNLLPRGMSQNLKVGTNPLQVKGPPINRLLILPIKEAGARNKSS